MEPASGPPRLAEACAPRIVEVADLEYEVASPTIRQGVEVLDALRSVAEGEFDDIQFLGRSVLSGWFPPDFLGEFVGLPVVEQTRILRHLLFTGVDVPEPVSDIDDKDRPRDDWIDLIAAYCETYGGEPYAVYSRVPFPFFLAFSFRIGRQSARAALSGVELAVLPHSGKKSRSMLAAMRKRAGYTADRKFTEEDYARDRAALKALAGMMGAAQA